MSYDMTMNSSRLSVRLHGLEYPGYDQFFFFIIRHVNIIPILGTSLYPGFLEPRFCRERREKTEYRSISQVTYQQNKRGDEGVLLLGRLITERQKYDWEFLHTAFCTAAVTIKASPSAKNFTVTSHPCWNLPSQTARIKQLNTDQWSASC